MTFDFDTVVQREGTSCEKYDGRSRYFQTQDVLPLWVADMDFTAPECVTRAIEERARHGVFGYSFRADPFYDALAGWLARKHQWNVPREWMTFSPGVVPSLAMAIQAFTRPGDAVIIQPPVYHPFFGTVRTNGRQCVTNPLRLSNGRYFMDLEDLEKKAGGNAKMLILCNPHNPGGMVWTRDELSRLSRFCLERGILVVSDEIHSDIIYKGHKHFPYAMTSDAAAGQSLTLVSPSKTFNIAGLATSAVIVPNGDLRRQFTAIREQAHIGMGNLFGNVAFEAAYSHGEEWHAALLRYLEGNRTYLLETFASRFPALNVMPPESTYLLWIDFRKWGFSQAALKDFLVNKAKLGLNNGTDFGPEGEGFMRLNFGCPRRILEEAVNRLENANK